MLFFVGPLQQKGLKEGRRRRETVNCFPSVNQLSLSTGPGVNGIRPTATLQIYSIQSPCRLLRFHLAFSSVLLRINPAYRFPPDQIGSHQTKPNQSTANHDLSIRLPPRSN